MRPSQQNTGARVEQKMLATEKIFVSPLQISQAGLASLASSIILPVTAL